MKHYESLENPSNQEEGNPEFPEYSQASVFNGAFMNICLYFHSEVLILQDSSILKFRLNL